MTTETPTNSGHVLGATIDDSNPAIDGLTAAQMNEAMDGEHAEVMRQLGEAMDRETEAMMRELAEDMDRELGPEEEPVRRKTNGAAQGADDTAAQGAEAKRDHREKKGGDSTADQAETAESIDDLEEYARQITAKKCEAAAMRFGMMGAVPYEEVVKVGRDIGVLTPMALAMVPESAPGGSWPAPLDLNVLAGTEPAAPRMLIDDWLPCGYGTLMAGHGGVGKSAIALNLGVCAALGLQFYGLTVRQCRVLYLSCEDRGNVLHWRLHHICAHLGIPLDALAGRLDIIDLVGHEAVLWERVQGTRETATPAYKQLSRTVRERGTEFLMVDGISDTYGGNENVRPDVKRYVNSLVALVPETGAVLLVGHVNRPTASGVATTEGYSGSTGWHNAVRARWYLYPEKELSEDSKPERTGDLILDLQKANLGLIDQSMRFQWDDAVRLFLGREIIGATKLDRDHESRTEREAILAAFRAVAERGDYVPAASTGSRTTYNVLSANEGFPKSLRGKEGKDRFRRHIEVLRRMQLIQEGSIHRKDRHSVATLVLCRP